MYNIAFHYSTIIWRRIIYTSIDIGFGQMVVRDSSKMSVYFNGCVFYKKNTRYHIFGIILRVGMRKGSMTELVHASKPH
jgi:hypothetical protein